MSSEILKSVQALVARGEVKISLHGYDELASDGIAVRDALDGLADALVVEEYPDYPKGPCVLVLERDSEGRPIHIVWGIPTGHVTPAVLVTGYRPDPGLWDDSRRRRQV